MENTYRLIIEDSREGSGAETPDKIPGSAGDKSQKTIIKTIAKVWGASSLVRTGIEAAEGIITRNMGNSQVQAKISAINSLAKQGMSVGLGFALGGFVGGGLAIASVGLSYARELEQYNYDKRWESTTLGLVRERAGASFNRSRTKY